MPIFCCLRGLTRETSERQRKPTHAMYGMEMLVPTCALAVNGLKAHGGGFHRRLDSTGWRLEGALGAFEPVDDGFGNLVDLRGDLFQVTGDGKFVATVGE